MDAGQHERFRRMYSQLKLSHAPKPDKHPTPSPYFVPDIIYIPQPNVVDTSSAHDSPQPDRIYVGPEGCLEAVYGRVQVNEDGTFNSNSSVSSIFTTENSNIKMGNVRFRGV